MIADVVLLVAAGVALALGAFWIGEGLAAWGRSGPRSRLLRVLVSGWLPSFALTTAASLHTADEPDPAAALAAGHLLSANLVLLAARLGGAAVLAPRTLDPASLRRDGTALGLATVGALLSVMDGEVARWEASVLFLGGLVHVVGLLRATPTAPPAEVPPGPIAGADAARLAAGAGLLLLGAPFAADRGVSVGLWLDLSGVSVGAWAAVVAGLPGTIGAWRSARADAGGGEVLALAAGNLTLGLGLTALARPLPVTSSLLWFEIPFVVAATAIVLASTAEHRPLAERHGVALSLLFVVYLLLRTTGVGVLS